MGRRDPRRLVQRFISRGIGAARDTLRVLPGGAEPVYRLPDTYQAAAIKLCDMTMCNSTRYLLRSGSWDFAECHEEIADFAVAMLKECRSRGFPFYVHCGLRTDAEQNALFAKGVSKARGGQSAHNHGMAVDIVHFSRGWNLTEKEWGVIGLVGKEVARRRKIKVTWGGDWKFYDPAHWELLGWSDRVRNGE